VKITELFLNYMTLGWRWSSPDFFYREAGTYSPTRLLSLSKYQEGYAQVIN